MTRSGAVHDEDFCAWRQAQVQEIRRAGAERDNGPIGWETAALKTGAAPARFPTDPPFTLDQAPDPAYPAGLFPPEWRA